MVIRKLTDTNGIDPEFCLDYSDYPRQVAPPKGDPSNWERKNKPSIGGVIKDILRNKYNGKKFKKYEQVEKIVVHLQNTPTYYVKYKNVESKVKTMIGQIHKGGVVRVEETEEKVWSWARV